MDRVDPEIERAFGVFRRPRTRADDPPEIVIREVALQPAECGLNVALARAVIAERVWYLVPGRGVLGCYDEGGAGGVVRIASAVRGHSVATSFRGTGRLLVCGLLPDDAGDVRIVRRNGTALPVAAAPNVYCVLVVATVPDELPDTVNFALDDHEHAVRIPGSDDAILTMRTPPIPG